MKYIYKIKTIGLLLLCSFSAFGQEEPKPEEYLPNIIPPSPEAYALGNYGNVPVGLFTGSPGVQIPLLAFNSKNISVPFSLSYSSIGIKVDDVNSRVGLGWNLIGGGVINRVIRDQPDEDSQLVLQEASNNNYLEPTLMQYLKTIGENAEMDSERDLFSYNFNGNSGQFVYDRDGTIISLPQSDFKIEVYLDPLSTDIYNFKITDLQGTIYYFEVKEQTMLRTSGEGHPEPSLSYSAWYLSKIRTIEGREVYINYTNHGEYYISSQSQQMSLSYPSYQYSVGKPYVKAPTISPINSHHMRVIGKKIGSIESNNPNDGKLVFTYQDMIPSSASEPDVVLSEIRKLNKEQVVIDRVNLNYLATTNKRIFLQDVVMFNPEQKYSFEYIQPNSFPSRLDKGRDAWGYYNGVTTNPNLIPEIDGYGLQNINYTHSNFDFNSNYSKIGLLSKVKYPTRGYSVIEYEPNDYHFKGYMRTGNPTCFTKTVTIDSYEDDMSKTESTQIFAHFTHKVTLSGSSSFYNCDSSMDTGANKHKTITSVFCVEDNEAVGLFRYDQFGNYIDIGVSSNLNNGACYFMAEEGKNYIVKLTNSFNCIRGYTSITYYKDDYPRTYQEINIPIAGNRVKSIIDYNNNDMLSNKKRYYYSQLNQLNVSSGVKGFDPHYTNFRKWREIALSEGSGAGTAYREFSDLIVSSSSLSNMYVNGSSVFYPYVTISYGGDNFENGAEEKQFVVNKDYFGKTLYNSDDISGAPFTNFGWNNGFEIETKTFSKKGSSFYLLKKNTNEYFLDETKTKELINFSARKKYDEILEGPAAYTCSSTDVNTRYEIKGCTTNHNHFRLTIGGKCYASGANNVATYLNHACYGLNPGDVITFYNRMDNIDIVEYKNISYRYYLKYAKTTDYFYDTNNALTGTSESIVQSNYDSPNHLQLTTQKVADSNDEEIETKYFYAHEKGNQALIDKNMIGIPLITQSFINNKKLSEKETVYKDWGNGLLAPEVIKASKGDATAEIRVKYNILDNSNGNPLEVQLESGIPITYIWGYNKTQPIAKIENATYAQVQPYEANLQTLSNGTDEGNLIAALDALRTALPNAMITTYTYKPLVGISTVTDSKGNKITYHYDSFNHLEFVKDQDGNNLSKNDYHYKN
ncbi:hypothetical protein [Flavobacterium sp. HNIBRBA15423]|uniref:hypothetical protein n=1 Tax=Flavobacterium sp. HNIBRBA15423 TaxID=3458683 RepID=UPI0040449B52